MEKKHIIFALKIFLASVLLGMFAGFLGVNPLGISQEQVIIASYSIFLVQGQSTPHSWYLCCLSRAISSIGTSTVSCSACGSCHPFVHECCTATQNKTLFQIGESYENT